VWCFFAAVASILVFFHVRAARRSAARLEISSTEIAAA
jgi:hypothetical protein